MNKYLIFAVAGVAALSVVVIKQQIDIHYLTSAVHSVISYLDQQKVDEEFVNITSWMDDLDDDGS